MNRRSNYSKIKNTYIERDFFGLYNPKKSLSCKTCRYFANHEDITPSINSCNTINSNNILEQNDHCIINSTNKDDCHTASHRLAHGQLEPLAYCKDGNGDCNHVVCKCTWHDGCW